MISSNPDKSKQSIARRFSFKSVKNSKEEIRNNLKGKLFSLNQNLPFFQFINQVDPLVEILSEGGLKDVHTKENFHEAYEDFENIGEGTVGLVKRCVRKSDGQEFAVKLVRTKDQEIVMNEFINLRRLDHPNIVKVYDLYYNQLEQKIYLVMELIKGKELFEAINQIGNYSEKSAQKIFKQILQCIEYLHSEGVCHRDLKPNNILIRDYNNQVKITDFNVAKFSEKYKDYSNKSNFNNKMWTYTGTIAFSAPEIFGDGEYTEAVDMWSAGVILYTMLSGYQPFYDQYVKDLIDKIKLGEFDLDSNPWPQISQEAKNLVKSLLNLDPEQRPTALQALKHPWFQCKQAKNVELQEAKLNLIQNLRKLTRSDSICLDGNSSPTKGCRSLSEILEGDEQKHNQKITIRRTYTTYYIKTNKKSVGQIRPHDKINEFLQKSVIALSKSQEQEYQHQMFKIT